jgi:hypothetical protein
VRAIAIALCALGLVACHRVPEDPYPKARAQYEQLVLSGARPTDPRFDPVVKELEQVPATSPNRPEAEKLLAAIHAGRGTLPPKPLAVPGGEPNESPDITAQRQACEALAKRLGTADGGMRERLVKAIDDCQKKIHQLEEAHEKGP